MRKLKRPSKMLTSKASMMVAMKDSSKDTSKGASIPQKIVGQNKRIPSIRN